MATRKRTDGGAMVFIDEVVLIKADEAQPKYMTRTAWLNTLVDMALSNLPAQYRYPAMSDE